MNDSDENTSAGGLLRRSLAAAVTLALVGVCRAVAASPPERVSVLSDSACPRAADVARELHRSLPDAAIAQHAAEGHALVRIVNDGERYTIIAADQERSIDDPERDCEERARVAAVFAAMALDPPVIDPPAVNADAPPAKPSPCPPPAPPVPDHTNFSTTNAMWLRLGLLTTWAGASEQPWALGPEVGLGFAHGIFLLQSSVAITTPSTLRFNADRARVVRLPAHLSAYARARHAGLETAVGVGVAVEGLHVAGRGDFTPHTRGLVQLGLRAAAQGRVFLGQRQALFCELTGTFVPSTSDLSVAPDGVVGSTPAVWLGVTLGGTLGLF